MGETVGGADGRDLVVEAEEAEARVVRYSLVESILDNLAAWAFVALAVAALFMVWATLRIVDVYVGDLPGMKP